MIPEHGKSFLLLLCHYALLVFVVVVSIFSSSPSSFILVRFEQITNFLVSVAKN